MDDSEEMQDLFLDDWDGIFDDDGPEVSLRDDEDDGGLDLYDVNDDTTTSAESSNNAGVAGAPPEDKKVESSSFEPVRRRRSREIEQGARGLPPPSWHSEAADRPHRQAMIAEMYVVFFLIYTPCVIIYFTYR